jgi:autotransporter-associated beta strand protein
MVGPGATTNKTDITFYLNSVQFPSGAPNFHIQVTSAISIGGSFGGGVINNSGVAQFFDVEAKHSLGDWLYLQGGTIGIGVQITNYGSTISGDDPSSGGNTEFEGSASAGNSVIYNNAAEASDTASGKTMFNSQSSAGAALVINFGATGDYDGGYTVFKDTSTAANAGIINEAGTTTGAYGGAAYFQDSSSVGNARITNNGCGVGSSTSLYSGVGTTFIDGTTAGSATILNYGGSAANAYGGYTQIDFCSAGTATITNEAGAGSAFGGETVLNVQASGGTASITNDGGGAGGAAGGHTIVYNSSTAGAATIDNDPAQDTSAFSGQTTFNGGSAGSATINNNGSGLAFSGSSPQQGGLTFFESTATAATATIINNGGAVQFSSAGGGTIFSDSSTGGSATLIANPGVPGSSNGRIIILGGLGGAIMFNSSSTGGKARVEVFGNGHLDISAHNLPGLGIGSIEGTGDVFLGANNLSIGSNSRSTTFSGGIQDGGASGGTGGSITKTGTGTLALSSANSYTGGTVIAKGRLNAKNTNGSATGTGAVHINSGTLGGSGIISGGVIVGNGSTSDAILQPGIGTSRRHSYHQQGPHI